MRLSGQYKASLFFYEKILSVQKAPTIFNLLEVIMCAKKPLPLLLFVRLFLFLLVGFG